MIPVVATVRLRVRRQHGGVLRLWLPLPIVIVWLLLLPFVIVLLPVFVIACLAVGLRPLRTLAAFWAVLSAMTGFEFLLEHREASIQVHLT
ncbi:MAG TPA: hypothetical protein VIC57_08370 [Candidatus Dormibacteraeota bacterium]|jgi:hypothetical protein